VARLLGDQRQDHEAKVAVLQEASDPAAAVNEIVTTAEELNAWYESGCRGDRPPGRLRPHKPERLGLLTRLWAEPVYRLTYDPDGRSWRDRIKGGL